MMYCCVPLTIGNCAWMMTLPAALFLWRKKGSRSENPKKDHPKKAPAAGHEDWLYVGKDEDGTPFYLDTESMSCESDNPVRLRMWVKYRPLKGSAAFLNVESFLKAAGRSHEPFDHIRQRLEIDFTKNLVGDLELVFHAPDGRAIESIRYRVPEWKEISPGSLYELLQKTAEGARRPDRFPADPELRVRVQQKLKEINEAFEAFDTVSPETKGPPGS
jgi:hypothetical protein